MKKERALIICIIAVSLLFCGCAQGLDESRTDLTVVEEEAASSVIDGSMEELTEDAAIESMEEAIQEDEIFLWLAYWDYMDYETERKSLGEKNREVSVFGVLFDVDGDQPFLTPDTEALLQTVMQDKGSTDCVYLSFINDLRMADGSYSNKDPELLARLLTQPEIRKEHINEIVELTKQCGVDGIEIDYENMKKKEELWTPFSLFLEELKVRCDEEGLLLRVVLGAYDIKKADFPPGIEYVIMCYNLYGTHSGPGPKADIEFLKDTFDNCKSLHGNVSAAFATGGFVWENDKCVSALTEIKAMELYDSLGQNVSEVVRDPDSGVLYYTYEAEGKKREVWYADGETLSLWKNIAKEYGIYKFSLWKAGGNNAESLRVFSE